MLVKDPLHNFYRVQQAFSDWAPDPIFGLLPQPDLCQPRQIEICNRIQICLRLYNSRVGHMYTIAVSHSSFCYV